MKILNSIKRIALVIFLFNALTSNAQYTVTSTAGYEVEIEITIDSISVVNSNCNGGWYNYNLHYSYDINFTGSGAPSNLWTLQANIIADDGNHFIPLPNSGGNSNSTSGSNVTRNQSDCGTATPASLGCDSIHLTIQGPGIPFQTIYLNTSALPIELISFDAIRNNDQVTINWSTAMEENNDYFTLEESTNGEDFYPIKQIDGAGNSSAILDYTVEVKLPHSGATYYRLKQTDFDGQYSYSPVRVIEVSASNLAKVFPNPSTGPSFTLDFGDQVGVKHIVVLSSYGQEVSSLNTTEKATKIEALARGAYFIQISYANGTNETLRFIQN